ncbi:hypothetical protein [Plesiomonas shigelloides]
MGFFGSCCSFVSSAISSVASSVRNVASSVYNSAKNIAGKAMEFMAEKAESFVDGVKNVWRTVKPYLSKIQTFLATAAKAAPWPWLRGAITALNAVISALTVFDGSALSKKIDKAINWVINIAKKWQREKQKNKNENGMESVSAVLSNDELDEAIKHQETFRSIEREIGDSPEREKFELASAINDYEISRTELFNALSKEPEDFEHYLRLRATQKLLNMSEKRFSSAETLDDLTLDDVFIVRVASDLVKANPELSNDAAVRLDRLLIEKYGRRLTPFVFEELIASWSARAKALADEWTNANRNHAKDSMLLKRLTLAENIQGELSRDEMDELSRLNVEVPKNKIKLDELSSKKHDIERYVGAAEGFLQMLEKSSDQMMEDDQEYLIEEGAEVGKVLIKCAESDIAFKDLSSEEQVLLTDYANIFKKESEVRMKRVLEVAA